METELNFRKQDVCTLPQTLIIIIIIIINFLFITLTCNVKPEIVR